LLKNHGFDANFDNHNNTNSTKLVTAVRYVMSQFVLVEMPEMFDKNVVQATGN